MTNIITLICVDHLICILQLHYPLYKIWKITIHQPKSIDIVIITPNALDRFYKVDRGAVIYILDSWHKQVQSCLSSQFYHYNSNIITSFLLSQLLAIYILTLNKLFEIISKNLVEIIKTIRKKIKN